MIKPGPGRHLLVFARDPVAGQVKTRLIPSVGAASATRIYRQVLLDTLDTGRQASADRYQLWIDQPDPSPWLLVQAERLGMSTHTQTGPNLGTRMHAAFAETLETARLAVLIGTDCPEFDVHYLESAFQALEQRDAVIGPAQDGGYVLLGLKVAEPGLFRDIPWGTEEVLAATRARMQGLRLSWSELPVRHDVDEPEDLQRFPHLLALTQEQPMARANEPLGGSG